MSDAFLDAILERIARVESQLATATRLARVTATDAVNLSVTIDLAGETVPGVRYLLPYSPTVGDFVVVTRMGASWVVHNKLSKDIAGPGYVEGLVTLRSTDSMSAQRRISPSVESWAWVSGIMQQGVELNNVGKWENAGLVTFPSVAGSLPAGATVTSATVRVVRSPSMNPAIAQNTTSLAAPRLFGHAAASTSTVTTQAPSSLWVSGFGPWSPGSLARGEAGVWPLPSTWLTALLANTIRGLGVWAASGPHSAFSTVQIQLHYTTPV